MNSSPAKIYGLIGYPVKHSFSPAMHNAVFKHLKSQGLMNYLAEYHLFEVKPEELKDFLESLSEKNIYGLNVTVPHKERVLDFVTFDKESFYLKQIKAVNTIVKKEGLSKGFNTDIPGFTRHLKEQFDPTNKRVAILGAGGAARAVSYALAQSDAGEISIFDIDKNKSMNVISMIKELFPNFKIYTVDSVDQLDIKSKDLLINATPIGLKETDPCLVDQEVLHNNLFVYDLIYNPAESKLLALAKRKGAKTSNGLGMLLYQGVLSFSHFTGIKSDIGIIEVMKQALEGEFKKCRRQ